MYSNIAITRQAFIGFVILAVFTLVTTIALIKLRKGFVGIRIALFALLIVIDMSGCVALVKWNSQQFVKNTTIEKTPANLCFFYRLDCQDAPHGTQEQVLGYAISSALWSDAETYIDSLPTSLKKKTALYNLHPYAPLQYALAWTDTVLASETGIGYEHWHPLRTYSLNIPSWIGSCRIELTMPLTQLSENVYGETVGPVYLVNKGHETLFTNKLFAQYASNPSCVTKKMINWDIANDPYNLAKILAPKP